MTRLTLRNVGKNRRLAGHHRPLAHGRRPGRLHIGIGPTEDELVACYHEAAALQGAGPSADLRAAVLAQAEVTAWKHADAAENPDEIAIEQLASSADTASAEAEFASELPLPAAAAAEAANDRRWFIPAVASVAVLGLAALLALQFDRSDPADQAVALGQRGAPAAEVAEPAPSEPTASEAVAASANWSAHRGRDGSHSRASHNGR